MGYDYFADYAKKAAHLGVEYTFPRNATIAVISGGVGWYAYQCGMTFGQEILRKQICEQFAAAMPAVPENLIWLVGKDFFRDAGWNAGFAASPLIVPWLCPYLSTQISLGSSLATSLTLNLIAQLFFGTKIKKDKEHLLPTALKKIGIEIPPPVKKKPTKTLPKADLSSTPAVTPEKQVLSTPQTNIISNNLPAFPPQVLHPPQPLPAVPEFVHEEKKIIKIEMKETDEKKAKEIEKIQERLPIKANDRITKTDSEDIFGDNPLKKGLSCWNLCC